MTRRTAEVVVNIRYSPPEMCLTLMGLASVLPTPIPPRKTKKSCLKGLSGHFLAIKDPRLWWESPLEPTEGVKWVAMAHGGCSIGFTGFTVKLNAGETQERGDKKSDQKLRSVFLEKIHG